MTRDLVLAWGAATGQADPQAWAGQVVEVLGQQRLGRSRQVLEMEFRPPQPADVPEILRAGDLSCRIRSPEAIYARAAGLLAQAPKAAPGDDQPVVVTTCGPLARAFREAAQSIAPSAIVPGGTDARKLVQLAAAPAPEERLRAVEEMLAASAVVPPNGAAGSRPGPAREAQGLYEPLVAAEAAESDIIAVPHADGYTHIRSVPLPARDDPGDKLELLARVKEQLSNVRDLMTSYPGGYELRFAPSGRIPGSRLWSLVRKPGQQAEVLFTFTLTDQVSGQVPSPGGPGPWFANALVRDAEVSKRFREEFEQLWDEAPGRDHTLHVLQQSIDKISAVT